MTLIINFLLDFYQMLNVYTIFYIMYLLLLVFLCVYMCVCVNKINNLSAVLKFSYACTIKI